MKIKNDKLAFYEVDKDYLKYLCKFDKNVREKENRR